MKYHKHIINKINTDLGEEDRRKNFTYEIMKNDKFIQVALTLSSAKNYIDNNYDENLL